jgi:hypothetical protein
MTRSVPDAHCGSDVTHPETAPEEFAPLLKVPES